MSHEGSPFLAAAAGNASSPRAESPGAHPLPLLEKARVGLADERPEVPEHVPELVRLRGLGNGLVERPVELREVPKQHALTPLEPVALHVVGEARERLDISRPIDFGLTSDPAVHGCAARNSLNAP